MKKAEEDKKNETVEDVTYYEDRSEIAQLSNAWSESEYGTSFVRMKLKWLEDKLL